MEHIEKIVTIVLALGAVVALHLGFYICKKYDDENEDETRRK